IPPAARSATASASCTRPLRLPLPRSILRRAPALELLLLRALGAPPLQLGPAERQARDHSQGGQRDDGAHFARSLSSTAPAQAGRWISAPLVSASTISACGDIGSGSSAGSGFCRNARSRSIARTA